MAESQAHEGNEQNETGLLGNINDNRTLIDFLKKHEGFKEAGYYATDSEEAEGKVTVGYGSTGRVELGEKVTEEQAEAWFKEDLASATQHIADLVTVELTNNQKTALISLVYNVGRDNLRKSKALKALNKGDFDTFMKEAFDPEIGFVKDKKGGTILDGLVERRAEERKLFNKQG
jgi:lysozyme